MLLRLVSLTLFILCLINFNLWRDERSARKILEEALTESNTDARASLNSQAIAPTQNVHADLNKAPLTNQPALVSPTESLSPVEERGDSGTAPLSEMAIYGIESRVAAIGNFAALSDQQRERLREKYTREALARKQGTAAETESLESIIGESNAQFYKQQLSSAFQKSQDQEQDREIFYLSRKLSFTSSQESRFRELLGEAESRVKEHFQADKSSPAYTRDPSFRVQLMMRENQFRSAWLAEQLKGTLTSDQYQAYLQEEADSSAAELGVWHAP